MMFKQFSKFSLCIIALFGSVVGGSQAHLAERTLGLHSTRTTDVSVRSYAVRNRRSRGIVRTASVTSHKFRRVKPAFSAGKAKLANTHKLYRTSSSGIGKLNQRRSARRRHGAIKSVTSPRLRASVVNARRIWDRSNPFSGGGEIRVKSATTRAAYRNASRIWNKVTRETFGSI